MSLDPLQVTGPADGPDDRCTAPSGPAVRRGRRHPEHAAHEHRQPVDRAVGENRSVGGDARDAQARADLVGDVGGQVHGQVRGDDRRLRGRPERPVGLRAVDPHPMPIRAGSTPSPVASTTPAPSLCGITRGKGITDPSQPRRLLVSPGFTPGNRTGTGPHRPPLWSYQTARTTHCPGHAAPCARGWSPSDENRSGAASSDARRSPPPGPT
jgi:hypothetical protein